MFYICVLSCSRPADILWNFIKLKFAFLHFGLCHFLLALWSCHIFSYLIFAFQSMKNSQAPDYSLQVANGETRSDHSPFYLVCWRKVDFHEAPPPHEAQISQDRTSWYLCNLSMCRDLHLLGASGTDQGLRSAKNIPTPFSTGGHF